MVDSDAAGDDGDEAEAATDETDGAENEAPTRADPVRVTENDVTASYFEADGERILAFEADGNTAAVAQNVEGYAMLKVRPTPDGDELERYYGFDMALDHAAELLGVNVHDLPIPEPAADMGM